MFTIHDVARPTLSACRDFLPQCLNRESYTGSYTESSSVHVHVHWQNPEHRDQGEERDAGLIA